jgi:hypothetical protein
VDGLRDTQRAAKKAENNKNKNDTWKWCYKLWLLLWYR